MVLFKDHGPKLSVDVQGVPEYVYYDHPYDITLAYANHGGAVKGPVELTADLPPTFFLAGTQSGISITDQHLVWQFDGLKAGESGTVNFTVKGVLPADLTRAVHNIPGYEGHTSFVEGFSLAVAMTAGRHATTAVAVADTGASTNPFADLTIIKDTIPDYPASFTFTDNIDNCNIGSLEDDGIGNGNEVTCAIGQRTEIVVTENDPTPQGFVLVDIQCTNNPVPQALDGPQILATITTDIPNRQVRIFFNNGDDVTCTFTNAASPPRHEDPPTATPTHTPTSTPTSTPTPTATPEQRPGGLGGLFAPTNPSPTPVRPVIDPPVTTGPVAVRPPSTGDGGLVR
jgi:hypothetical protein